MNSSQLPVNFITSDWLEIAEVSLANQSIEKISIQSVFDAYSFSWIHFIGINITTQIVIFDAINPQSQVSVSPFLIRVYIRHQRQFISF